MKQEQTEVVGQSETARAERMLDNLGLRIGFFMGNARQRMQDAMLYVREEADRLDQLGVHTQPAHDSSTERVHEPAKEPVNQEQTAGQIQSAEQPPVQENVPQQPTTERAEQIIDGMVQRIGSFAAATNLQSRRVVARVREDAEDMWAEARSIRDNVRPPSTR